jgi:dipeptidyl-peptidase-4
MLHEIYYNIGVVEVQDQIDVTKQLIDLYPFIDSSRVAIWGWSYGGFVTASVLAADADQDNIFKCGISVAPVTNWIYYDSIYTERYVLVFLLLLLILIHLRYLGLPTPEDNLSGYQRSDVTAKAAKLANKKYLMVHGTADDNVHYQQSMMLARAMEEADVLFRQLSYPDEAHGLVGLRPHFYHALTDFLLNDCFGRNEVVSG